MTMPISLSVPHTLTQSSCTRWCEGGSFHPRSKQSMISPGVSTLAMLEKIELTVQLFSHSPLTWRCKRIARNSSDRARHSFLSWLCPVVCLFINLCSWHCASWSSFVMFWNRVFIFRNTICHDACKGLGLLDMLSAQRALLESACWACKTRYSWSLSV